FSPPTNWVAAFGNVAATGGMTDNTTFPRFLMDMNGDGLVDVVGFTGSDVLVSFNTGSSFTAPASWLHCFFVIGCGTNPWLVPGAQTSYICQAGLYTRGGARGTSCNNSNPRFVLDMNGDGLPDIIGFDASNVWVSLNTGSSFAAPTVWLACSFTPCAG